MKIIQRILIGLGIIPALIMGMMILVGIERLIGYYPGEPGWYVAKIAVEKGKDVHECKKIIGVPWIGMGPSTGEQRETCIHEYAKLAKDPSACELLMPSSYGFSCLGAALDHRLCIIGEGQEKTVRGQGKVTTYDQCIARNADTKEYSCCVMARTLFEEKNTETCDSLKTVELKDECNYFQAREKRDAKLCNSIENERTRAGCAVAVKALLSESLIK